MSDLAARVRDAMRPLAPRATGLAPKLPRLEGIRAAVFDLYGTLLVSAAGGGTREASPDPEGLPGFERVFWESVRTQHALRRAKGVAFPEIEVRETWAGILAAAGGPVPSPDELEALILDHECRANPVWPMPGAAAILGTLREAGYPLGIVSNAQFYTLPVVEGLFGADLDALGFHPRLRVFSFEVGEGKPSPRLFELLRERAGELGIAPAGILYLGNDFHKDVLPARAAGFRTALFAGDDRSLRLGDVPPEEAAALSDAVITDLAQLPALLQDGP